MNKIATTLILAACLAACSKGSIIVTVNGEPDAAERLKKRTISTQVPKDTNIMTKQAERALQAELKREGFCWVPAGGDITMQVAMGHGWYGVGKIETFGPAFTHLGSWETYQHQTDIVELDMTAIEKGKPFWEARISGSGEWLNSEYQPGCIRELLRNHTDENTTSEERCYKPWWP